jgi:cell division inhibitor SulA/protein ImuA
MRTALLDALLQNPALWRGSETAQVRLPSIPTGFSALDRELPGGGWPRATIAEILSPHQGIGELSLLIPALSRLSQSERWIALIDPPHIPYAPALAASGVDLSHLVLVRTQSQRDAQWSAEQALRAGSCAMVLAWPSGMNERDVRRLQLAAEEGGSFGALFLPDTGHHSSPAPLRLRLAPGRAGLAVHIVKRRSGGALPLLELDTQRDFASLPSRSQGPAWYARVAS